MNIPISYYNLALGQFIQLVYDNVTHAIVSGDINPFPISEADEESYGGVSPGSEVYRQTVGTDYWSVRADTITPYAYVLVGSTLVVCDLTIDDVNITPAMNGNLGSIDVDASGTGTKRYDIGFGKQAGDVFNDMQPGPYRLILSRTEDLCEVYQDIEVLEYRDILAAATATKLTAVGADDGKVRVTVLQGSGDYTVTIDGAEDQVLDGGVVTYEWINRAPGTYLVEVTDNLTGQTTSISVVVANPIIIEVTGTVLAVPFLNPISFVDTTQDGLDNLLFCQQVYKGYKTIQHFQKWIAGDLVPSQFNSNYPYNFVKLYRHGTNAFIVNIAFAMKEENVGKTEDFSILIKDHGVPGKSRVYFNTGTIPIPVLTGQTFTVKDNGDGMDGDYTIEEILVDSSNGFQYLVFNVLYAGGVSSAATGEFLNTLTDFNVFEFTLDTTELEGQYYLTIEGSVDPVSTDGKTLTGEPIDIQDEQPGTHKILYRNTDNAFGMTWTTGIIGLLRIDGSLFKRLPRGERSTNRTSNDSLVKLSARKRRGMLFEISQQPPYMIEKLSVLFDCDNYSINGVSYQSDEDLTDSDYQDGYPLADTSIRLEQLDWFDRFNSNDIMTNGTTVCDEIDLLQVSTALATITLNLNRKKQRVFVGSPTIDGDKTLALSNDSLALKFDFIFVIDGAHNLTLPAEFKMSDALWTDLTKVWACAEAGRYKMESVFDGSYWNTKINLIG